MKRISYLFVCLLAFFIANLNVEAASMSIWASSSSVTVGSTVTVSVSGKNLAGYFKVSSSNSSVLSGGGEEFIDNDTISFTFKANATGSATITATALDASTYDETNFTGSKSITISVVNKSSGSGSSSGTGGTTSSKKEYSSDNKLKSLTITDYELKPKFDAKTYEYSIELDSDVTEIEIKATANDDKASVKGDGKVKVNEGANKIEIVVTAENGNDQKYIINATVKDLNPVEVTIDKKKYTVIKREGVLEVPEGFDKTTAKINNQEVLAYYNKTLKYTIVGLKDKDGKASFYIYDDKKNSFTPYHEYSFNNIALNILKMDKKLLPEGYKKYSLKIDNQEVDAYKLNKNSDNYLVYAMNLTTGKKDLYVYDKKDNTVQRYTDEESKYFQEKANEYLYWIIGLSIALGLILVTLITVLIVKQVKKKKRQRRSLR